jgi:hypothetical protein
MMKPVSLALLTATCIAGAAATAAAQPWGGGYYDDDPGPYRYRYRERYYDDDGDRYYDRRNYYRERRAYRTWNGCPPRYTVQDGVCKPYTGR